MSECRVVAVIVTFNRVKYLRKALNELPLDMLAGVVVVNNASSDGTSELLNSWADQDEHHKLVPLHLDVNVGGAGGFEAGVRFAHQRFSYTYLVLFDDDSWPAPGCIACFLNCKRDADLYSAAVYYPSGDVCPMNLPGFFPFHNMRRIIKTVLQGSVGFRINRQCYLPGQRVEVDFASFVGLFIRSDTIEHCGYPDPSWFLYGDDVAYTIDIRRSGRRIVFDSDLIFYHDCETFKSDDIGYRHIWKLFFRFRNGLALYARITGFFFPVIALVRLGQWCLDSRRYKNKRLYFFLLLLAVRDFSKKRISNLHILGEEIRKRGLLVPWKEK